MHKALYDTEMASYPRTEYQQFPVAERNSYAVF